jgi:RNA polymerase sigma factor (sigma-70 family)
VSHHTRRHPDYLYKEIPFDPFYLDSIVRAPVPVDDPKEEEKRRKAHERSVKERMRAVRKAMRQRLTPRQNDCLRLYYLRGRSQREIAAMLGIHQTTVSQHIRYATKKLRQLLNC